MKVRTLRQHPYAGVDRSVGEIYEMEDKFVDVMTTVGCVVAVPEIETTDMQTEKPRKNYKRRDIKAR